MERCSTLVSREVVGAERTAVCSGGDEAQALFSSVMRIVFRTIPALFLVAFAAVAGASVTDTTVDAQHAYTDADIKFLDGMIAHHAQALLMAGWASSHGASPTVLTLTSRITNAQTDEIAGMQKWLRDRHQPVPEANPHGMTMKMDGMEHTMLMPGMLTEAQLKQLDDARGKDFDRLFLTFMIQHHQGAVTMVTNLFDTYGAAQDISVFKLASDISADQTTEIERMQKMLASVIFGAKVE
jgi:uncharacterized protein (DUF305 family)